MAAAISSGSAARIRSSGDRNGSKRAGIDNEATIAGYGRGPSIASEPDGHQQSARRAVHFSSKYRGGQMPGGKTDGSYTLSPCPA